MKSTVLFVRLFVCVENIFAVPLSTVDCLAPYPH